MQISNCVKLLGNGVGMPVAAGITWVALAYVTTLCLNKIYPCLPEGKPKQPLNDAQKIGIAIIVTVPTLLTLVVLPRILPFTQVSYGIVPHWNWDWIQARLPS